jgi:hypothetical protein
MRGETMKNLLVRSGKLILVSCLVGAMVQACGAKKDSSNNANSGNNETAANKSGEAGLQLKNASLLSQSVEATFGAGRDLVPDPSQGRNGNPDAKTSCFEVHKHTLGSESNLRFGEIFADSPSTQYFMSLSICASKIATACKADVDASGASSRCDCSTPDKAKALLQRAISQVNFSDAAQAAVVAKVSEGCKTDYKGTISSIVSSLAFAQR